MQGPPSRLELDHPVWMADAVNWDRSYPTDRDRMAVAVELSLRNVEQGTGGPFGAAIFEESGRLVSVGVNSVVRLHNCTLHAEMVAFMMAQHRVGSFTLAGPGMPPHELFTSCEPCAMCLGAALWSGIGRLVFGATGEDVRNLGFDEGPVFAQSHGYLRSRGIDIESGLLRSEACRVLERYKELQGPLYNRVPAV